VFSQIDLHIALLFGYSNEIFAFWWKLAMGRRQRFLRKFALGSSALIWACGAALAQQIPDPVVTPNPVSGAATLRDVLFKKTPSEIWLSCLVVAFGLVVIAAYIFAIRKIHHRRTEDVSRALIVVTVITGSLLLITAGYSNQQVAPAFGLFGTIVGYMLGRMSAGGQDREHDDSKPDSEPTNGPETTQRANQ
jgi:hypothetical protein